MATLVADFSITAQAKSTSPWGRAHSLWNLVLWNSSKDRMSTVLIGSPTSAMTWPMVNGSSWTYLSKYSCL